ncbi:hypothetical protein ACSQ67_021237 [Phaseolus vulgaris]
MIKLSSFSPQDELGNAHVLLCSHFEFETYQINPRCAIWKVHTYFTYWLKFCDRDLCNTANSPMDLVHLNHMSETDLAVIKPEMMKPYVWLQTSDDSIQQVEQEIAMFCPLICQEIIQKGMGSSKNCAICLPQQVSPSMLSLILDYCRFHQVPGRSNKERKSYDEKFVRIDTERLCELTSAADSLQLKPLVDLTSRALARIIEGKTPEEIRDIFHLPDDLTEVSGACENSEEKLEPLRNITADPRIRLLNRLYAKKRKELRERERLKNVEVEEEHVDDRSVDDLLSFINGKDGDPKGVKTSKNKKKNRRKKEQQKNSSLKEASELNKKVVLNVLLYNEANGHDIRHQSSEAERISETSHLHDAEDDAFTSKPEFDDGDMDDEIDPALKEKIDRWHYFLTECFILLLFFPKWVEIGEVEPSTQKAILFLATREIRRHGSTVVEWLIFWSSLPVEEASREVEDFARRLNSDWPERMQELLSSGQERKTMLFTTDGFLRRHAFDSSACILISKIRKPFSSLTSSFISNILLIR